MSTSIARNKGLIIVGNISTSTPAPALPHRGHPPLFLLTSTTASDTSSTAGTLLLLGAGELFLITSTTASDPFSTAETLFCPLLLLLLGALPHRNKLHSTAGTLLLLFGAGARTGAPASWADPHLATMKMMSRRTSALSIRMGTVTIRSFSL